MTCLFARYPKRASFNMFPKNVEVPLTVRTLGRRMTSDVKFPGQAVATPPPK